MAPAAAGNDRAADLKRLSTSKGENQATATTAVVTNEPFNSIKSATENTAEELNVVHRDLSVSNEENDSRQLKSPSCTASESDKPDHSANFKESLACPDCGKVFRVVNGLQYHVKNKVCHNKKTRRRKHTTEEGSDGGDEIVVPPKKQKRNRGTEDERTCPHCKRVFTSILGKDYHVGENSFSDKGTGTVY